MWEEKCPIVGCKYLFSQGARNALRSEIFNLNFALQVRLFFQRSKRYR
jgi:hypothetical protein